MRYRHRFKVRAPLAQVAGFHSQSQSLAAITPPPVRMQLRTAPSLLGEDDRMEFTLWIGILPIHWCARIEQVSTHGFVDRQISGPFRIWEHRHIFVPLADNLTEVQDEVNLELRLHPYLGVIGLGMFVSLPFLFAYRAWKTRRLLEKQFSDKKALSDN